MSDVDRPGTAARPLRVAIVGAGPAGFYAADQLFRQDGLVVEIDMFDRRSSNLSQRLYDEALACRMRPFADGVQGCPRLVRDLARSLGKQGSRPVSRVLRRFPLAEVAARDFHHIRT